MERGRRSGPFTDDSCDEHPLLRMLVLRERLDLDEGGDRGRLLGGAGAGVDPVGDPLAPERQLDFLAGLVDPPLHGRKRDLERVGDLGVRETDDVA